MAVDIDRLAATIAAAVDGPFDWKSASEDYKDEFRKGARAALDHLDYVAVGR